MGAFSDVEKTVDIPGLKQQPMTTRKIDNRVLVEEDMKGNWDEANDGKKRTTALIAVHEMVLLVLNQAINCATGDLVQLMGQYARLSLAGSYSAQVRCAVNNLEQTSIAMGKNRTAQKEVRKVRRSLDHMKRKLELLSQIEEDGQKEESG